MARVVEVKGRVRMLMDLTIRFDYGSIVPWVRHEAGRCTRSPGQTRSGCAPRCRCGARTGPFLADFTVAEGEAGALHARAARLAPAGPRRIDRSGPRRHRGLVVALGGSYHLGRLAGRGDPPLLTLKALTYAPTGGIVAAPPARPEQLGGVRNWDYRYCWLRDSTFTLSALMLAGLADEAKAWRSGCCAVAGQPQQMQILQRGRRTPHHRAGAGLAERLPGVTAGPDRQRGRQPVPARRLRRGRRADLHVGRYIGLESDEAAWDLP